LPYTSVKIYVPARVTLGEPLRFTVSGSIGTTKPDWPNFAVGVSYLDGPDNFIKVVIHGRPFNLWKGSTAYVISRRVEPGTVVIVDGTIEFRVPGVYDLAGAAGYVDESKGVFIVDSQDPVRVEVLEPGIEIGWIRIPWWVLALAGGCVAVISTVAIVAYIEREREMALLMSLLSRR
jgi:hypothetical protein